ARRHHQAMHALAEFGIALILGIEIGARAAISRLPCFAAIARIEHTRRRDADPDLLRIARMRNERMEDEAGAARVPFRPRRVIAQPFDRAPALRIVARQEQACRLHAGVKPARAEREAPDRFDRLLAL